MYSLCCLLVFSPSSHRFSELEMASHSCLNPSIERTVLGEGDFTFIVESAKRIHSQQGRMQEGVRKLKCRWEFSPLCVLTACRRSFHIIRRWRDGCSVHKCRVITAYCKKIKNLSGFKYRDVCIQFIKFLLLRSVFTLWLSNKILSASINFPILSY